MEQHKGNFLNNGGEVQKLTHRRFLRLAGEQEPATSGGELAAVGLALVPHRAKRDRSEASSPPPSPLSPSLPSPSPPPSDDEEAEDAGFVHAIEAVLSSKQRIAPLCKHTAELALDEGVRGSRSLQKTATVDMYIFDGATYRKELSVSYFLARLLRKKLEESKVEGVEDVVKHLDNPSFRDGVVKEVLNCLADDELYASKKVITPTDFAHTADTLPYLFGFRNGLFDFQKHLFYKKGSVPSEYIVTRRADYDYEGGDDGAPTTELKVKMARVTAVYQQWFPDPRVFKAMQAFEAATASGVPASEWPAFGFAWGPAGNGKTPHLTFLSDTLGKEHVAELEIAHFMSRLKPNEPDSKLLATRGAKLVRIDEVPEKAVIKTDLLKRMTGGDPLLARGPGQRFAQSWVFNGRVLFAGNYLANFEGGVADQAIDKRLLFAPFESRFVDHVNTGDLNTFKKDFAIIKELETLKSAHFLLWVEWSKEHAGKYGDVVRPYPCVKEALAYIAGKQKVEAVERSPLAQWIDANYRKTRGGDECKDSDTCPVVLREKKKRADAPLCAFYTRVDSIITEYGAAQGGAVLASDVKKALMELGVEPRNPENRHINARDALMLGRKDSACHGTAGAQAAPAVT